MKIKAIVATLLIAATASADARFAWPYPRKAVSPDESGHWIVINDHPWSHDVESKLAAASPFAWPTGSAKNRCQLRTNSATGGRDFTFCEMPIFECLK